MLPTSQYFASKFVISAGCVLFRKQAAEPEGLEICIIHDRKNNKWILGKGRKDCGESIAEAAVRETFEETGYPCTLLPCRMATRAPRPGVNGRDAAAEVEGITEPFSVVVRDQGPRGVKLIWWYIARATGDEKVAGTQTAWEEYDSHWVRAEEAAQRLSFPSDIDTIRKALEIVRDGNMDGLE